MGDGDEIFDHHPSGAAAVVDMSALRQARQGMESAKDAERRGTLEMEEPMLRYFRYAHLPKGAAQATSRRFSDLAQGLVVSLPRCSERTVALRKLLESKDAAVRAVIFGP